MMSLRLRFLGYLDNIHDGHSPLPTAWEWFDLHGGLTLRELSICVYSALHPRTKMLQLEDGHRPHGSQPSVEG